MNIYLDYMSSTPLDHRVFNVMLPYFEDNCSFGNASNISHEYGRRAADAVTHAKVCIAACIKSLPDEIFFTSGATEANNLAILGVAKACERYGKHIITTTLEHASVLNTFEYLQQQGFEVTYLNPDENGVITTENLLQAVREDTILVSIMHVNNEIGSIQPIQALARAIRKKNIIFHSDCAQSVGKVVIDLENWGVHLASFSAHKVYGPKGIGALYINSRIGFQLPPILHGGGQQDGIRPGTLPVPLIVGMGEAFSIADDQLFDDVVHINTLRELLWKTLKRIGDIELNSSIQHCVPHCLNVSFNSAREAALVVKNIACSAGSACTSGSTRASHVLLALGRTEEEARNALRFSFGRMSTGAQLQQAADIIAEKVTALRQLV